MQFDTKLVVVLRDDLAVWQKANVTAFLVSGIAGTDPATVGEPYRRQGARQAATSRVIAHDAARRRRRPPRRLEVAHPR